MSTPTTTTTPAVEYYKAGKAGKIEILTADNFTRWSIGFKAALAYHGVFDIDQDTSRRPLPPQNDNDNPSTQAALRIYNNAMTAWQNRIAKHWELFWST